MASSQTTFIPTPSDCALAFSLHAFIRALKVLSEEKGIDTSSISRLEWYQEVEEKGRKLLRATVLSWKSSDTEIGAEAQSALRKLGHAGMLDLFEVFIAHYENIHASVE